MSFTPFGILPIDQQRAIFRLVPISARIAARMRLQQTRSAPLLRDDGRKQLVFALSQRVSRADLLASLGADQLPAEPVTINGLKLPGAELDLSPATITWSESRIEIRLEP